MEKLRILHIVPNMQSGGLETFIMNIYRNINREKIQFDFLVHYKARFFYDDEIEKMGGKIYRFSLRDDNNIIKYIRELNCFFKNHREYSIVHCHMASVGSLVFLIAKKNGIKIRIAHSHNSNTENTIKGKIKKILMIPYKYCSSLNFACSKSAGEFLFKKRKFEIINNGIEIEKFRFNKNIRTSVRKQLNISDNEYVLGHVGRFCEQKNHKFVISVFNELLKRNKNIKLILVGNGELEGEILDLIKKLGIDEKVIILKEQKNIEDIYQAMDIFVFPSVFEGLGIVLIEAQASGLSVICSENIPKETRVSNNIVYLELKKEKWVEKIMIKINERNDDRSIVDSRLNNFNINTIAECLEKKYIMLYKEITNER